MSSKYFEITKELREKGVFNPTPEAILLEYAYKLRAQELMEVYRALRRLLDETAKAFNQPRFILTEEAKRYMEEYVLGKLRGETKTPREEKQLFQLLVLAALAGLPEEIIRQVIEAGAEVLKYGFFDEGLNINTLAQFREAIERFHALWDQALHMSLTILGLERAEIEAAKERREEIYEEYHGSGYFPCWLLAPECWTSGRVSRSLVLKPVEHMPIFPKTDAGSLQAIFGTLGSGKTFLLSSIICYSVLRKRELVFIPLNDGTNSFSLAPIPIFPYNANTRRLIEILDRMGIKPQGLPTLILTVLRDREAYPDRRVNPPTIFDRIIRVENYREWRVDFDDLVKQLREIGAEHYGFGDKHPAGVICVRNLNREVKIENLNYDAQAATMSLSLFEGYRRRSMEHGARVVIDEISFLAPSQAIRYASDALRSGATISDFIKESRRLRVSVDAATQRILEILPEIRSTATNIFFRDLPVSKDKMRSEMDFVLESIQLRDESLKDIIKEITNRGELPKYYWFWHNRASRSISVIKPLPPTFCPYQEELPLKIVRLYEKQTGQKILLKSWSQVPEIKAETPTTTTSNLGF